MAKKDEQPAVEALAQEDEQKAAEEVKADEQTVEQAAEKVEDKAEEVVNDGLVEVKLKMGEQDHDVHLGSGLVRFLNGIARVEEEVKSELKKLGLIH